MSCEDDVKALVEAGYRCNPYSGSWLKTIGEEVYLSIMRLHGSETKISLWQNGLLVKTEWCQTVSDAIAAGDKWLEGKDDGEGR